MTIAKAIARAWSDPDYKTMLLNDPHTALAEVGVDVSTGAKVKVLENSADTHHMVLPLAPANVDELSADALEKIAGGMGGISYGGGISLL